MTTIHVQKPAFVLALFLLLAGLSACDPLGVRGRGDLITETRNAKDFHALEVNVHGDVDVFVDTDFFVEVTCEDNIIDYLDTEVEDGVLKIHFDRSVYDVDDLHIVVHAPAWDAFEINGSADVHVKDLIEGDQLDVRISGSGDLECHEAVFDQAKISVSGSGDVELNGSSLDLDVSISGSGNLQALNFPVKKAKVALSGSGEAKVDVSDQLDVTVSGSGDVYYQGSPVVTSIVSGSGRVHKL
jgi:hypothetical protein